MQATLSQLPTFTERANGSSGNVEVHHQELEVGARPQRVEVGVASA